MPTAMRKKGVAQKLVKAAGKFLSATEVRVQGALARVKEHGFRPSGQPKYSFRKAADDFEVNHRTLTDRFHGRQSHREAAVSQQRLAPIQEKTLKEHMNMCALRGISMNDTEIKEAASIIAERTCGDRWLEGFRERNPDLVRRVTRPLDAPRAQALNHNNVAAFYALLKSLVEPYGIRPEDTYNMDEKGVMLGKGQTGTHVLVDRNIKTVSNIEDGNRENVTIIECVCADGTAIRPGVIFKGAKRNLQWGAVNPCNARCVTVYVVWSVLTSAFQYLNLAKRLDRPRAQL
jgi:hypothetical protein